MSNPVLRFAADLLERATKTGSQAALLSVGEQSVTGKGLDVLTLHWLPIAGFAAGGFILSILTSLASLPVGNKTTASVLSEPAPEQSDTPQSVSPNVVQVTLS